MTVCNISDILSKLRRGCCLLGLDPGQTVLGIAVSDPMLSVASPLVSLPRKKLKDDIAAILKIVADRNVGGIVVGLPLNMDGTEGPSAQSARSFVHNLRQHAGLAELPFVFWDERLSSAAVERFLLSDNMSRERRDAVIDKAAAAYILQGALDRLKVLSKPTL